MKKLIEFISQCNASISININYHKDMGLCVKNYLTTQISTDDLNDISDEVKLKMIETDTIIELEFFAHPLIGYCTIHHYDLEMALDDALKCLD